MLNRTSVTSQRNELPVWPEQGLTRVPYWLFQDRAGLRRGAAPAVPGPAMELPVPGGRGAERRRLLHHRPSATRPSSSRATADGELYAFENRCAHRGALIALEQRGNAKDFSCVYHAWTYDRQGNLIGVAFKDGIKGKGGMPPRSACRITGRASCGWPSCTGWCSAASPTRCPRSRSIWARRSPAASSASWRGASPSCSAGTRRRCPTTGSSTWRTSRTPITPASCTCSSRPSS